MRLRTLAILFISFALVAPLQAHHIKQSALKEMPATTSSPKARELFERALQDYSNLYLERANIGWRAAVEADPNFALAYVFIAYNSSDPEEAKDALEKAKLLAPKASPGEEAG
jgi:ABC-type branched-subunit amino acid transport system substrate-binding protein